MSSILDALEKANRERSARRSDPAKQDLSDRQSALERQLRDQQIRHRRQITLGIVAGAVLLLLLAGAGVTAVFWRQAGGGGPAEPQGEPVAAAAAPAGPDQSASAPPEPEPVAEEVASPAQEARSFLPQPRATPSASPTPSPTPAPTPQPTAHAAYIQNTQPADDAPAGTYTGLFQDGDILRPADLGLAVDGVMELRSGLVALVNGREVRAGNKIGELHVVDVQFGVLTIDVGDGTIVRVRF